MRWGSYYTRNNVIISAKDGDCFPAQRQSSLKSLKQVYVYETTICMRRHSGVSYDFSIFCAWSHERVQVTESAKENPLQVTAESTAQVQAVIAFAARYYSGGPFQDPVKVLLKVGCNPLMMLFALHVLDQHNPMVQKPSRLWTLKTSDFFPWYRGNRILCYPFPSLLLVSLHWNGYCIQYAAGVLKMRSTCYWIVQKKTSLPAGISSWC